MIGIYNLEPKYTNIALEKIKLFYLTHNEGVRDYNPLEHLLFDKIYCSSIFTFTDKSYVTDDMICGGSGFDLTTTLRSETEEMKPKINMGFATRGCIRNCPFCIVPEKEGNIRVAGDIYDFWDRESKKLIILDNNILALPDHFKYICDQIKNENLMVDFNQGLDHRLLNDEIAEKLRSLRYKEYRFAFDSINYESSVRKAIDILHKHEIKWSMWYVLVGFDTTYNEDLSRLLMLKSHDQRVFVQRYNNKTNPFYTELAGWANQHQLFHKYTFEEFLERRRNKKKVNDFLKSGGDVAKTLY